jgi:hypothetical protein
MLTKAKNVNNISAELENSVPELEAGEQVTFQMLNGIDFLQVDVDSKNDKRTKIWPKEQVPLWGRITDPHTKKTVTIGVPKVIENDEVKEWKTFIPGADTAGLFSGKFTLSGDNIDDKEMYSVLMLLDHNRKKKGRNEKVRALYENVDYVADAKTKRKKSSALRDALNLIENMGFSEAKELARALNWPDYSDEEVLFAKLEEFAKEDPEAFNSHYVDPLRGLKSDVKAAEEASMIAYDQATSKVLWVKGNVVIAQLDKQEDKTWIEQFASWLQTHENGSKVHQSIKKQLRSISKSVVE